MARFVTSKMENTKSRPLWFVRDSLEILETSGPYERKHQAKKMADRWNAAPELANLEMKKRKGV